MVRFFVKSFPINFKKKKKREKRRRKSWGKCLLASKLAKSALELNNRTRQLDDDDDDVAGNDDDYDDSTEPSLASTSVCFYCFRTSPCPVAPSPHRARLPLGSRSVVAADGGYSTLHKRHFLQIFPVFVRFYSLCRFVLLGSFAVVLSIKRKLIALDPQREDRFGIALDPMEGQFGIHQQRHAEAHGKEHDQVVYSGKGRIYVRYTVGAGNTLAEGGT